MFRFTHSEYLYALLTIPFFIILFWVARRLRKKALKTYGNLSILLPLMNEVSHSRPVIKFILLMIALVFLIFGIAGPQFGSKLREVKREGIELVIALDVSNSMLAEDIQPSRLEMAKRAVSKLIDRLENDRIALVVFAGDAYVQLPITTDYPAAKMMLDNVSTNIVPKQGTAIGAAIETGMNCFSSAAEKNKAIIIITDGENHEDDALEKAKEASGKNITVHTLGMGLPQGTPIPQFGNYGQRTFKTDKEGQVVISKLNETMLQQIAAAGGGAYIRASNTQVGLDNLFAEINKLEKKEMESQVYSEYEDRYQYLIAVALFFLFVEFLFLERKNKRLSKLNLFKLNT